MTRLASQASQYGYSNEQPQGVRQTTTDPVLTHQSAYTAPQQYQTNMMGPNLPIASVGSTEAQTPADRKSLCSTNKQKKKPKATPKDRIAATNALFNAAFFGASDEVFQAAKTVYTNLTHNPDARHPGLRGGYGQPTFIAQNMPNNPNVIAGATPNTNAGGGTAANAIQIDKPDPVPVPVPVPGGRAKNPPQTHDTNMNE